ncbi:hypothetical protein ACFYOT_32620 [Saccharothrix saharensis]|uniref:hypothetical protein n=1 Tax=Saccharothrix saharensis TaxID=571190 RepID=UPI00367918D0
MSRITRLVPAAVLAFATVALPFTTAGHAHATVEACADYLGAHGYQVTYAEEEACWHGAVAEYEYCTSALESLGVWRFHAYEACLEAAKE